MNIRCWKCQTLYDLDEHLFKDASVVRVTCRKCGNSIVVARPEAPVASPPPPSVPLPKPQSGLPPLASSPAAPPSVPLTKPQSGLPPLASSPAPPPSVPLPKPQSGLPPLASSPAPPPSVPLPKPQSGLTPLASSPAPSMEPYALTERKKTGWVSPSYRVSREIRLDPAVLEKNRVVAYNTASPEIEAYRVLRTRIVHRARGTGGTTVMVTSALPGEGKTVTAVNLALTFAKAFSQTALLVDADLKRQQVHRILGFESDRGLGDYLLDGCDVSDLIVWPGIEKLTIISGGKRIEESSELLGSPGMRTLVEGMKARYVDRYIFFDVPPVLAGADAISFAPLVDHILFVVQANRTSLADVRKALQLLPKEKVLGLVVNRQSGPDAPKYYY